MTEDDHLEELHKRATAAIEALGEHFNSIQLVATVRTDAGNSAMLAVGVGSYHERLGATKEWIILQDEKARSHVRRREDEG